MDEKISVIVPIYNVEKYLHRCIESIINQTYRNIEIILVNDGSTDDSKNICEKYLNKDKRIKLINKKNGGLSEARNAGLKKATGEIVSFIDSDDFIETNFYEYMLAEMKKTNSDIAICGTSIDYENGKKREKVNLTEEILDSKEAIIKLNSFSSFDMSVCNKIFKRDIVKNIEFPIGKKSEDYFVTYKYLDKAKKIVVLPKAMYHYYQRPNSISRGKVNISYDYIEGSLRQKEYIEKRYPDIQNVANTAYAFSYIAVYNRYIENDADLPREKKKKFKKEVKKYIKYIISNEYINNLKKIQAIVFSYNLFLYKLLIKILK